jgi:hypothetical protein
MVAFAIEHDPETGYHLLGGGCFDDDELGLRGSLGDGYDEVIGSLIEMTDETRIRSLLTRPGPGAGTSTLSGSDDL